MEECDVYESLCGLDILPPFLVEARENAELDTRVTAVVSSALLVKRDARVVERAQDRRYCILPTLVEYETIMISEDKSALVKYPVSWSGRYPLQRLSCQETSPCRC